MSDTGLWFLIGCAIGAFVGGPLMTIAVLRHIEWHERRQR